MTDYNKEILKEICEEKNIQYECLSFDYITRLTKNGVSKYIFGAYWGINSAAADRIACDKAACYTILNYDKIPAIQHELLSFRLLNKDTALKKTEIFFNDNKKIVVKPNQGTMGKNVFLCNTIEEAKTAVSFIFNEREDAAISPYHETVNEYRVFYLNGEALFIYGKEKGNTWHYNLTSGAKAFEVFDNEKITKLQKLSKAAGKCIGITFATIDIIELLCGEFKIMEINCGIQANCLLEQIPHLKPVIKNIFTKAVLSFRFETG